MDPWQILGQTICTLCDCHTLCMTIVYERPSMSNHEHHALPTVRELLLLPEVQAGNPEVIAGFAGEDRTARWAHVVAGAGAPSLLDGGELVLTTGAGWPHESSALRVLAQELTQAGGVGAAAIMLELGAAFHEAPRELVDACNRHGVPLIVLHREVRFVQITQRVHQRVLGAQTEALAARAEVHAMLTELGLNRSPVDYVIERLASTLDAPVVLEDLSHRVVAVASHGHDTTEVLAPWQMMGDPRLPDLATRVTVEARGTRWGYLTALPGPPHPAGRHTVLELGAFALALGRLSDTDGEQWQRLSSKRVFEALLGGRYRNDTELAAQLTAAGLPLEGRVLLAATLRGTGDFGGHATLEHATLETALRRAVAPEGRVLITGEPGASVADGGPVSVQQPTRQTGAGLSSHGGTVSGARTAGAAGNEALLAIVSLPPADPRLSQSVARQVPALAARLAHELDMLVPGPTPSSWRAHLALATPVTAQHSLRSLVASIEQLRATGRLTPTAEVGRVTVQQPDQQQLAHLVRSLSGAPELQQFTLDMLGPLIEHDRGVGPGHAGDLLQVLAAYTEHPTNRSLAARQARLSRSVFYQRLELIERLLGVNLADGRTIAGLTVALLAQAQ